RDARVRTGDARRDEQQRPQDERYRAGRHDAGWTGLLRAAHLERDTLRRVTTAGAAYCWGDNTDGELGNGTTTASATPVAVSGGLTFAAVSAGFYHTCGVTTPGAAYCWGFNGNGQLGNGTFTISPTPVAVSVGLTFAAVSVEQFDACGVTTAGAAYCWGDNTDSQLGKGGPPINTTTPARVW